MPLVSVVMPVYNPNLEYLQESINSILNQTFDDFEFIIIDDNSDEEINLFLKSIDDHRVKIKRNINNLGVTKSLNIGFGMAKGKYIARMDCDDISFPDRLQKQFDFMNENPDVIVCGCGIKKFCRYDELDSKCETYVPQINDMELFRIRLLFCNCGPPHPTAFFNRELLIKYAINYNEDYYNSQDYAMWVSCSKVARMHIINDVMLAYRVHPNQISTAGYKRQLHYARKVRESQLKGLFSFVSEEMVITHEKAYGGELSKKDTIRWYKRLKKANKVKKKYDIDLFSKFIDSLIYQKRKDCTIRKSD